MTPENHAKLEAIVEAVIEMRGEPTSGTGKGKRWDSIAQVSIITAVESEFNITLPTKDYQHFKSFDSIESLLGEMGL